MHEATPITAGERTNLIVWMYRQPDGISHNSHAQTREYPLNQQMTTEQRWRV